MTLPVALLHARAIADILIVMAGLLFLVHARLTRDASWLRKPFVVCAMIWWAWQVLCSALGTGGLGMSLVAIRLPLLAVAAAWALRSASRRGAVWWMLAAAFGWIVVQCWEQQLTGTNLFGHGRYMDGALTGPFVKPKAGPALILIFFPVVVPATMSLLSGPAEGDRQTLSKRLAGTVLAVLSVVTMVLIGQRMPTALMVLGLLVTALLLPRLRLAVIIAASCAGLLLAAAPVLSPGTYGKLVLQTRAQLTHFPQSAYGLIFVRAAAIAQRYPVHGLGFDGYRRGCSDIWNMHGIEALHIPTANLNGGMDACNIHPHNYYLEQADNAGIPGVTAFAAMAACLIWALAKGVVGRSIDPHPLGVGVLVGIVLAFWPMASTSAFTSLPNAGWLFLVAGIGLSLIPPGTRAAASSEISPHVSAPTSLPSEVKS